MSTAPFSPSETYNSHCLAASGRIQDLPSVPCGTGGIPTESIAAIECVSAIAPADGVPPPQPASSAPAATAPAMRGLSVRKYMGAVLSEAAERRVSHLARHMPLPTARDERNPLGSSPGRSRPYA